MLDSGTRLGAYEIIGTLGVGGMGEVYRARDTRLNRDVAIKVLAEPIAHRREVRDRFEREARAIAGLNHPHICVLHDIGRDDGVDYLVMEYLEGETLAQRLKRGSLPLAEVLLYGVEIGDALSAAHRKGLTHRDLKPGNIILTKGGAKLLDFGLAKLRSASDPAEQATQGAPITAQGTILGTLHYMSPEQLEGNEADPRSDIFSFGAVLYEMATGTRAFDGKSQASVISSIMTSEPAAMFALQPMTPPVLDRVVRKCLRKDADARWQSVHDITDELRWIAESTSSSEAPAATARAPGRSPLRLAWAGAAAVLAVVAIAALARFLGGSPPASIAAPVRFTVGPPEKGSFPPGNTNFSFLSVSPDGTMLAFVGADASGKTQVWIRGLNATTATPLAGAERGLAPSWSPDSRFVSFVAEGSLKKVAVSGGPAQTVAALSGGGVTSSWSSRGVILFSAVAGQPLSRVADAGGKATAATELDAGANEIAHSLPSFLPDGEHYLFLVRSSNAERSGVYVGALGSRERTRVLADTSGAVYVRPGYLVFNREGTLMAQPFDTERLATTGDAVPIVEGVQFNSAVRAASFAVSQTGVLAYRTASDVPPRTLVWVSRNGTEESLAVPPRGYQHVRLSADGGRIAVQIEERDNQIWVFDTRRETLTRLTFHGSDNQVPIWAPDGKRVTYYSNQSGALNLFWQLADGSSGPERLTTSVTSHAAMSWTADGRRLAFTSAAGGNRDIWVLDMTTGKAAPFLQTIFTEGGAQFSPDGRWMAYVSNESGRPEIYVQPYPGPGGKWQVSTDGGSEPMWNRDGRELFYRTGARMMAVPVSTRAGFSSGRPQLLFERRYASIQLPQTASSYDVSSDGRRFLMVKETEEASSTPISVILNWEALLNPRAPAGTN